MIGAFFKHMPRVVFGYLVAALAANSALLGITALVKSTQGMASLQRYIDGISLSDIPLGTLGIAAFTLPVFLVVLLLVETAIKRHFLWFIGAGFMAPLIVLLLISGIDVLIIASWQLSIPSFSGALGGLTYWAIAGRHAGCWQEKSDIKL